MGKSWAWGDGAGGKGAGWVKELGGQEGACLCHGPWLGYSGSGFGGFGNWTAVGAALERS